MSYLKAVTGIQKNTRRSFKTEINRDDPKTVKTELENESKETSLLVN